MFASLVAFIFIQSAFKNVFKIKHQVVMMSLLQAFYACPLGGAQRLQQVALRVQHHHLRPSQHDSGNGGVGRDN